MPSRPRSVLRDFAPIQIDPFVVAEGLGSIRTELPLDPIHPADIESGNPIARSLALTHSPDDRLMSGLWECTAGRFKRTCGVDEIVFILEGEATVREETGAVHDLRPGDVAYFPLGLELRWDIPHYVRKFFVIRNPGGHPHLARWRQRLKIALNGSRRMNLPWCTVQGIRT